MVATVSAKHILGVISGSTAKDVSPTRPLVTLFTASRFTRSPRRGATAMMLAAKTQEFEGLIGYLR